MANALDQSNTPIVNNTEEIGRDFGGGSIYNGNGQSFVPAITASISRITVKLRKAGTPTDNLRIDVYSDNSGTLGTLLGTSSTISGATLTTSDANYNFDFVTGPTLTATTTYWYVVNRSGSVSDTNYYIIRSHAQTAPGSYASGVRGYDFGGTWYTDTNIDHYFLQYYTRDGVYWVGGTADWDGTAGTKWALTSGGTGGVTVPTENDDVYFDANSGAVTVTVTEFVEAKNLDFTGFTGTFAHNQVITLYGNLKLVAGMTYTHNSKRFDFEGSLQTNTVTTAGKSIYQMAFLGDGAHWTFADGATVETDFDFFMNTWQVPGAGVDFGSGTFTAGSIQMNNSGQANIDFGSANITADDFYFYTYDDTITPGTSSITVNNYLTIDNNGNAGGFDIELYDLTVNINSIGPSGGGGFDLDGDTAGSYTFHNLTVINSTNGEPFNLVTVVPVTVDNNLTLTGTATERLFVAGVFGGTYVDDIASITCNGTVSMTDVMFFNITASGTASWTGTLIGDAGRNSGITFTAVATRYWIGNGGDFFSTAKWSTSSGGTGGASIPLPQDTVVFDANSITSASQTITVSGGPFRIALPRLDFSGLTTTLGTLNLTGLSQLYLKDGYDFTNITSVSTSSVIFVGGNQNVKGTTLPNTLWGGITVRLNNGATITQQSRFDWNTTSTLNLYTGNWDANDFNASGGYFVAHATSSENRTITMGSGTWTMQGTGWSITDATHTTITPETSTIVLSSTSTSAKSFDGAGKTYYNLSITGGGTGVVTINGSNTFNNFTIGAPKTVAFANASTQTINGTTTLDGSAGNVITLKSSTNGQTHTLSSANNVTGDFLNIRDSIATGAGRWVALQSVSTSNNTGWIFGDMASSISGAGTTSSALDPAIKVLESIISGIATINTSLDRTGLMLGDISGLATVSPTLTGTFAMDAGDISGLATVVANATRISPFASYSRTGPNTTSWQDIDEL